MSDFFPSDMIENILSRLPVKSLLQFRCVSKYWYTLISDPYFMDLHLNKSIESRQNKLFIQTKFYACYSYDFEAQKTIDIEYPIKDKKLGGHVWGSCNGLLCIVHLGFICLFNPATRDYSKITETPVTNWDSSCLDTRKVYGFGYDPLLKDYKVVRLVTCYNSQKNVPVYRVNVDVYSRKMNEWRSIPCIPYHINALRPGALSKGALHWVVDKIDKIVIIAFDIATETFRELPILLPEHLSYSIYITPLGEHLSLSYRRQGGFLEEEFFMWILDDDYRVNNEPWTELYNIGPTVEHVKLRPLCYTKSGAVLMLKQALRECNRDKSMCWFQGYLVLCERQEPPRDLPLQDSLICEMTPYTESLVSISNQVVEPLNRRRMGIGELQYRNVLSALYYVVYDFLPENIYSLIHRLF